MPDSSDSHAGSSAPSPERRSEPPRGSRDAELPPVTHAQEAQDETLSLKEEEEFLLARLLSQPGLDLDTVEKMRKRLMKVRRLMAEQEKNLREKEELQRQMLQLQLALKDREAEHAAELSNLYNRTGELQSMELQGLQLGKEKTLRMMAVKQEIRQRISNSGASLQSITSHRTTPSQLRAAAQASGIQLPDEVLAALEAGMARLNMQGQETHAPVSGPPFQAFSFPAVTPQSQDAPPEEKPTQAPFPAPTVRAQQPQVTRPSEAVSFASAQDRAQWYNQGALAPRKLAIEEVSCDLPTPQGVMVSESMPPDQGGKLPTVNEDTWIQMHHVAAQVSQHAAQSVSPPKSSQSNPMALRLQQWSQGRAHKSVDTAPPPQGREHQPYAEQGSNLWGGGLESPPFNMMVSPPQYAPPPSAPPQEQPTIVDGVINRTKSRRDDKDEHQRSFTFERMASAPRRPKGDGDDGGDDPTGGRTERSDADSRGKFKLLGANVTLDNKNSPEFTADPGIIPNMELLEKGKMWWTDNDNKVCDNTNAQFNQILRCSKNDTAIQFIVTHKEEMAALCPEARPLLDTLTTSTSALSLAKTFAMKAFLFKSTGTPAAKPMSHQELRRRRLQDQTMAKHLLGSFLASTGEGDDLLPNTGETGEDFIEIPLWWAFIIVVMHHLCKAQPKELLIYENEMHLGVPNALSPRVLPSESPKFFFIRVQETYKLFNRFDQKAFHRVSNKKDALEAFVQGLPIELQEVAEKEYRLVGTEVSSQELELSIVAQVQATYSYLISLEGKNGLNGGTPKGMFGGWAIHTPAMRYAAKYPADSPSKLETAKPRFPAEMHPSKYPRRPHVLYDKVTQDVIPIATAAAAAASREFIRSHLDVDEDEAREYGELEKLNAHTYARFDEPHDESLAHAHVGATSDSSMKARVSFNTPTLGDPLKTMHPRNSGAPPLRNTPGPAQPVRVSTRSCVVCLSKDHFADRCPHLQAMQSSPELLSWRKRMSIPSVHAQVANASQEDILEETLAVDPNPPPIPSHWIPGSYTSHLEHAQHMATHPDWPPGMPVPTADAFSYACHVGLQWPIEAGVPISCSTDVSFPQSGGKAPVEGSLSKASFDPVNDTEALVIMPVKQQAPFDPVNDTEALVIMPVEQRAPVDPVNNAVALAIMPVEQQALNQVTLSLDHTLQDKSLAPDGVMRADSLMAYSRESKKVYPASFLPERDPARLRAAADPRHSKITLPPTQHLTTTSGDVPVPTVPPQKRSSAPSAQLSARPPARTPGDKAQRPLSFQVASPVINPWENLSKGTAALAAHDIPSVRLTASSNAPLSSDIQASPEELITRYLASLNPRLSYFPREEDPFRQVGIMIHGQKVWTPGMLHDWGSDVAIMSHDFCIRHNIPIFPTSMRLSTSNGVSTALEGCTAPICISYGAGGGDREIRTSHSFLVVKSRPGAPFTILIGNKDGCDWGGVHDMGTHTLSLRTKWTTMGAHSPVLSFPLDFRRP